MSQVSSITWRKKKPTWNHADKEGWVSYPNLISQWGQSTTCVSVLGKHIKGTAVFESPIWPWAFEWRFFFNTTEVFPEMRTLLSSLSQLYGIYLKKRIAPGSWAWQARINSQGRTLVGNPHSRDSMLTVAHQTSQQARSQPYSLPWSQKKQHCQLWVPICTGRHSSDTQLEGL